MSQRASGATPAPSTIVWTGKNQEEVTAFCGRDRLGQPAANIARFWDGQPLLSVWTDTPAGETTYPVRVGETISRDAEGRLTIVGADTSDYERTHPGEAR